MNIEEYINFENTDINIEKIKIPEFSNDEINIIEEFIEFTRHIQEIDQLFRIFKINLKDILLHYELNDDDTIYRKIDVDNKEDDGIIINALIINYISSAKTFIESIENFLFLKLGKDEFNKFKEGCLSRIYDDNFSYRLLIRLRDYAQHGHLPVNVSWDKKYSFDLEEILYTPHFNHNSKLQREMKNLSEKIHIKAKGNPRIMFKVSIIEFQLCIIEIYNYFINTIKERLIYLVAELDKIIKKKPSIIYKSKDILDGFILYYIDNEKIHCFDPKEDSIQMINDIKNNLEKELEKIRKDFDNLFNRYEMIKI